ncbi:MAG: hypothetical protein O3B84_04240 [Chloroflexi bacterium]|nr:hypothetical protein [Chloroflexota bacterium]
MDSNLTALARRYREEYGAPSPGALLALQPQEKDRGEAALIDAVSSAMALDSILNADEIDLAAITPPMMEAFSLSFPGQDLVERIHEAADHSADSQEMIGFINNWKGKFFEVLVRDELNAGNPVGDVFLTAGQTARLAASINQPGWDLAIDNADGTVAELMQLKATDSLSYVKKALERYDSFRVLTTTEAVDEATEAILSSGMSVSELEDQILEPMADLFESPMEQMVDFVLPGLPFILITTTEGVKAMLRKQSFQEAFDRSVERGAKTGAGMAVGTVADLVGLGLVRMPVTMMTRIGIDRFQVHRGLVRRLASATRDLRALHELGAA